MKSEKALKPPEKVYVALATCNICGEQRSVPADKDHRPAALMAATSWAEAHDALHRAKGQ